MNSQYAYDLILKTGISNIELENAIIRRDHTSFCYALYIINQRFELGEKSISKDDYYSYYYAIDVLKARFRLGEERIYMDHKNFDYHICYVIKILGYNHE